VAGCTGSSSDRQHVRRTPAATPSAGPIDPLFPTLGNRGEDVRHYGLTLRYRPSSRALDARTSVLIEATRKLETISLDYAGPGVVSATIDGAPADFRTEAGKLTLRPEAPVDAGQRVTVLVHSHGVPQATSFTIHDRRVTQGWIDTGGSTVTMDEPDAAHTWFPCNDHPSDKATFTFAITAPAELTAIANGDLTSRRRSGDLTTWTYEERDPMATYLAQVAIGRYAVVSQGTTSGVRLRNVFLNTDVARMTPIFERQPEILRFLVDRFGAFPSDTYGGLVANGFQVTALETQTMTTFNRSRLLSHDLAYGEVVQAHEMTHQWFGDAVSLESWGDIWLNEGFATYGQWLWEERIGGLSPEEHAVQALENRAELTALGPTAAPKVVSDLFGDQVYSGGALALQALRDRVGDTTFFRILRTWYGLYRGRNATTPDFLRVASEVAGQDLRAFLSDWLYEPERPLSLPSAG
jgi:aminopeptidase N